MNKSFLLSNSPPETESDPFSARLEVDNFLHFKNVELPLGQVTILTGPQAAGKSLLARLVDFFHELLSLASSCSDEQDVKKRALDNFRRRFPEETWSNTSFSLRFSRSSYAISLKGRRSTVDINFSSALEQDLSRLFRRKDECIHSEDAGSCPPDGRAPFLGDIPWPFLTQTLFIPARRDHCLSPAALQAAGEGDMDQDPALAALARHLSAFRTSWEHRSADERSAFNAVCRRITEGEYPEACGRDLACAGKEQRLPVHPASSGQLHALPLLMLLQAASQAHITVEEPEAHLFPKNQKDLATHLVRCTTTRNNQLVMTTHSSYVLATVNNLIAACDVLQTSDADKIAAMEKILPRSCWLSFARVQCFFVDHGTVEDLKDPENRMMDFEKMETCADEIVTELNDILSVLD